MSRTSVALAAAIVAVAGCGGAGDKGSDTDQVKRAVTDYAHAFGGGDGKRACRLLTASARDGFVRRVSSLVGTRDCAEAVSKLQAVAGENVTGPFQTAAVDDVRVTGERATARVVAAGHSEQVPLVKTGGDWLLDHVPGT